MENKKLIHSNEYHLLRQSDIQKEMKTGRGKLAHGCWICRGI